MFNSLQPPIAVVAHDAGAANQIIAWVKNVDHRQIQVCVSGPALSLWKRAFPLDNIDDDLVGTLSNAKTLISGTGWASSLEHDARIMARKSNIKTVAVIDHWTNYRERFSREGSEVLPDEIWVTDEYAKLLAEATFPNHKILLLPNLYLNGLVEEVRIHECLDGERAGRNMLYLLEPIREAWGANIVEGEFAGLNFLIDNLAILELGDDISIKLRPHPSDATGKYDGWIATQKGMKISLDHTPSLAESLAWSDIVVGCQTYAMVVAVAAGKRVVSTVPPWAPPCNLPQPSIIKLADLLR